MTPSFVFHKSAHELLFRHLAPHAAPQELEDSAAQVEALLDLPQAEQEDGAEPVFRRLAEFTAQTLLRRLETTPA